jgi:hypothetical protein
MPSRFTAPQCGRSQSLTVWSVIDHHRPSSSTRAYFLHIEAIWRVTVNVDIEDTGLSPDHCEAIASSVSVLPRGSIESHHCCRKFHFTDSLDAVIY